MGSQIDRREIYVYNMFKLSLHNWCTVCQFHTTLIRSKYPLNNRLRAIFDHGFNRLCAYMKLSFIRFVSVGINGRGRTATVTAIHTILLFLGFVKPIGYYLKIMKFCTAFVETILFSIVSELKRMASNLAKFN